MALLTNLRRRAPWVGGAVLLAMVGLPVLALGLRVGLQHWAWLLGAGAILILLAGWLERLWQSRPVTRPRSRSAAQGRFRVLPGGRAGESRDSDDDPDKPQWLM